MNERVFVNITRRKLEMGSLAPWPTPRMARKRYLSLFGILVAVLRRVRC